MTLSTKCRVIIDTNVYISGILFDGNSEKVLDLVKKKKLEVFVSPDICEEVLSKIKFFPDYEQIFAELKMIVDFYTVKILPQSTVNICRDSKDNMFLSLATDSSADFLITGDKDLLVLKKFKKTKIVTPKEFLASY